MINMHEPKIFNISINYKRTNNVGIKFFIIKKEIFEFVVLKYIIEQITTFLLIIIIVAKNSTQVFQRHNAIASVGGLTAV